MASTFIKALIAFAAIPVGLSFATPAGATPFNVINETFVDPVSCGFPVQIELMGKVKTLTKRNSVRDVYANFVITQTNLENGKTDKYSANGNGTFTPNADGSLSITLTGANAIGSMLHHGLLKIVENPDGSIDFVSFNGHITDTCALIA
jgi:hypothetical protein